MRLRKRGVRTSAVEVTNVSAHGLWVLVKGKELFLPYQSFPWFKEAKLADVLDVRLCHRTHLHWPALDVDLCLESIEEPDRFPLVYR